jgi:nickel-type superoxide dismutase maturation protease
MLKFIKVTGESLSPDYQEGDYVMVVTFPFLSLNRGDIIVFRHPVYGTMIKKISHEDPEGFYVIGNHPNSIDSRQFGSICRDDILGKVIWHIKKPISKAPS